MKNKNQFHKITFEVRKAITELSYTLPKTPFFIPNGKGGYVMQVEKKSRILTGEQILDKNPEALVGGKRPQGSKNYISVTNEIRTMNHLVELNKAYQNEGQLGIDKYVAYITGLSEQIKLASEKKEEQPGIVDKSLLEPQPEDFGYSEDDKGVITWVTGGEAAYDKALAEYYDIKNEKKEEVLGQ